MTQQQYTKWFKDSDANLSKTIQLPPCIFCDESQFDVCVCKNLECKEYKEYKNAV